MPSRSETAERVARARDRVLRPGARHLRGVRRDDLGAPLPRRPGATRGARDAGLGAWVPLRRKAGLAVPAGPGPGRVAAKEKGATAELRFPLQWNMRARSSYIGKPQRSSRMFARPS